MRKAILILIMGCLCCVMNAQNAVYSYNSDGNVVPYGQFVDALHEGSYTNTTPYELRYSEVLAFNTDYTIRSLRYKNWGADPGDFHVIEVLYHGNCIYTIKDADGWEFFPEAIKGDSPYHSFYAVDMGDKTIALVFGGTNIMSQPPLMTVVVVKDGVANMVFNKPFYINSISRQGQRLVFSIQANTVECVENNAGNTVPSNAPEIHTLTIENQLIYYR